MNEEVKFQLAQVLEHLQGKPKRVEPVAQEEEAEDEEDDE